MENIDFHPDLLKIGEDGLPLVSIYSEFLRITRKKDSPDTFEAWFRIAYLLMSAELHNA